VFIGATFDRAIRAFDIDTGRELWKGTLPAGARATPMTYAWKGRQYVVISAGGGDEWGAGDYGGAAVSGEWGVESGELATLRPV
jgi:quinoprotein glucose dehydrogenase